MLVATLIKKLQSMPQHVEVLIEVGRFNESIVLTTPDQIGSILESDGNEIVYITVLNECKNNN